MEWKRGQQAKIIINENKMENIQTNTKAKRVIFTSGETSPTKYTINNLIMCA